MIVNITVFSLFAYYIKVMWLAGPDEDKGFLMLRATAGLHETGRIQVSPTSSLLRQDNLKRVCSSVVRRMSRFPLYQLIKRNHNSSDLYQLECDGDCMDMYLECLAHPFKLEKTGDVRVSFQSQWSALCMSPPLPIDVAEHFCQLLGKPIEIVKVLSGDAGNYTTNWTLSLDCGVDSSESGCRPWFPSDIHRVLITEDNCNQDNLVAISCKYDAPQFKIERENDVPRGVLQIQVADSLVNLCSSGINLNLTRVICRSMGYASSDANYNLHVLRQPRRCMDMTLGLLRCVGDELTLTKCPYYHGGHGKIDQTSDRVVNISCSNANEGKTRVTGGFDGISGRLEVYHAGRWGTVCRNGFGQNEARAACYSVTQGMMKHGTLMLSPAEVAPDTKRDDIWLDEVRCSANGSFEQCSHSPWGEHVCFWNEIVNLQCSEPPMFKIAEAQSLLVYHNGEWGGVCASYVRGACCLPNAETSEVGSSHGRFITCKAPSWGTLEDDDYSRRIWLERLDCDENSVDVNMCTGWDWGKIHLKCKGTTVTCGDPEESDVSYSLVEMGSQEVGIVELQYRGEPRYICSDYLNKTMARVACRSLRLPEDNAQLIPVPDIRLDFKRIWIKDASCTGHETSLLTCPFANIGLSRSVCPNTKVLAVSCGKSQVSDERYPLRLTGGEEKNGGIVQAQVHGVWGDVCLPISPISVEAVVCRQLGYLPAGSQSPYSLYKNGTGVIAWLGNVQCSGNEEHISDCELSVGPHLSCYGRLEVKCGKADIKDVPVDAIVGGTVGALCAILIVGTAVYAAVVFRRNRRGNTSDQPRAPVGQRQDLRPSHAVPRHQHEPRRVPTAPPQRHEDAANQPPPYVIPLIPTRPQSADEGLPPSYDELFPDGEPKQEVQEFEA